MRKASPLSAGAWYHSAPLYHDYKVGVHAISERRVYFRRFEMDGMSISSVESFRGIVRFPAIRTTEHRGAR
jgi:hypothetical protein